MLTLIQSNFDAQANSVHSLYIFLTSSPCWNSVAAHVFIMSFYDNHVLKDDTSLHDICKIILKPQMTIILQDTEALS